MKRQSKGGPVPTACRYQPGSLNVMPTKLAEAAGRSRSASAGIALSNRGGEMLPRLRGRLLRQALQKRAGANEPGAIVIPKRNMFALARLL